MARSFQTANRIQEVIQAGYCFNLAVQSYREIIHLPTTLETLKHISQIWMNDVIRSARQHDLSNANQLASKGNFIFDLPESIQQNILHGFLILLEDQNADVRLATIQAIGKGLTRFELLPLLHDSDSNVRWDAIQALGDRALVSDLLPLLHDIQCGCPLCRYPGTGGPGSGERSAPLSCTIAIDISAMPLIQALGDRAQVSDLLPLLHDSVSDVRYAACKHHFDTSLSEQTCSLLLHDSE